MSPLIKEPIDKNNLTDSEEKHIPFITIDNENIHVICGNKIIHPMEEDHWIISIELFKNGESINKKILNKTDKPEANFTIKNISKSDILSAHAFCNLHGIWKSL